MAHGAIGYGAQFKNEAAFHAQQCIEKAIKAYLAFHRIRFRKTHYMDELIKLVRKADREIAESLVDLDRFTAYATAYRYPDSVVKAITFAKAKSEVKVAKRIYDRLIKEIESQTN